MPWGGSAPNQTYTRSDGTRTGSAVNVTADGLGINNTALLADNRENDFATALNLVWKRDGGNQPSANLPMNDKKFTGMAAGSARTDSIRLEQVQDGDLLYAAVGGTADAIELNMTPASGGPVEGMSVVFIAGADNTGAATIDLDGGGAVAVETQGAALVGGEIKSGQVHRVTFDGTAWQLENPSFLGRLASTANGLGASLIGIEDSGTLITATTVEGALAENRAAIDAAEAAIAVIEGDYLTSSDIGVSVQAYNANLDGWSAEDPTDYYTSAEADSAIAAYAEPLDADILKADTSDDLEAGFTSTSKDQGTKTTGTFTPAYATGNIQHCVNGGAFTLAPPTGNSTMVLDITNNASAGTITTSGFTLVTGDDFTTSNGDDFRCYISTGNAGSHLHVAAMQ